MEAGSSRYVSGGRRASEARANLLVRIALMTALVLVGVLSIVSGTSSVAHAAPTNSCTSSSCTSYTCGDVSSNHCYAEYIWIGGVDGGETSVNQVVHMYGGPSGFINDELWLVASSGCSSGGSTYCWVEVGMEGVEDNNGNTQYFWADNRPNGGGFHNHYFLSAPSGDYGHQATFQIWRTSSSNWTAAIYTYTSSYYGYSTSNPISISWIEAGSELGGGGTVYPEASYAPVVHFTHNMWKGTGSQVWNFQDYHHYNQGSGILYGGGAPPPFVTVVSTPDGSANSGGDFETWCC